MNNWKIFLQSMSVVSMVLAVLSIVYFYNYNGQDINSIALGFVFAIPFYFIGRGFWLRKEFSLYAWTFTIPLSLILGFIIFFNAGASGYCSETAAYIMGLSPLAFAITTTALVVIAYKKTKETTQT